MLYICSSFFVYILNYLKKKTHSLYRNAFPSWDIRDN